MALLSVSYLSFCLYPGPPSGATFPRSWVFQGRIPDAPAGCRRCGAVTGPVLAITRHSRLDVWAMPPDGWIQAPPGPQITNILFRLCSIRVARCQKGRIATRGGGLPAYSCLPRISGHCPSSSSGG